MDIKSSLPPVAEPALPTAQSISPQSGQVASEPNTFLNSHWPGTIAGFLLLLVIVACFVWFSSGVNKVAIILPLPYIFLYLSAEKGSNILSNVVSLLTMIGITLFMLAGIWMSMNPIFPNQYDTGVFLNFISIAIYFCISLITFMEAKIADTGTVPSLVFRYLVIILGIILITIALFLNAFA